MVVKHNLVAMNSNRMFGINNKNQAKNSEKLSSGYRINRSADDAAGLAISEKMRRQIRGLSQASLNAQDGISAVQIADGAMEEVHSIIHRGTELSIKAANGTLTDTDRSYIQDEIEHLKTEIDDISNRTDFNEIQVLKGGVIPYVESGSEVVIKGQLPDFITMDQNSLDSLHLDTSITYITQETYIDLDNNNAEVTVDIEHAASYLDFSNFTGTQDQIDELIGKGFYTTCCTCSNHYSIEFTDDTNNSVENSGNHYIYKIGVANVKTADELLEQIINGTDNGNPKNHYTKFKIDNNTLIIYDDRSSKANPVTGNHSWKDWDNPYFSTVPRDEYGKIGPGVAYSKNDAGKLILPKELKLQIGAEAETEQCLYIDLPAISSLILGINSVNVETIEGAYEGIDAFKNALEHVSKERSRMGAYQNRLEHTIRSLDNTVENTQASESKIRDTDMAKLMVQYTNGNILAQAGQAMLAQANQNNQGVLNLLG